jgi:PLP dependent protein
LREEFQGRMKDPFLFKHLSMGMSHDYPLAIEEGATLLRIGTAIFGNRLL